MNAEIFKKWMRWFDREIFLKHYTKGLLLLDNFSAYISAVDKLKASEEGLPHIKVCWLPANATSYYQPLDQSVINTTKAYWKKKWMHYIMDEADNGRQPHNTINVLIAAKWWLYAWRDDVDNEMIAHCFIKSEVFGRKFSPENLPKSQYKRLLQQQRQDETSPQQQEVELSLSQTT
ncbi:DDE-domain-containing protein [Viridothelium virens]|uniref:DDE-domain-containing protein n=1 Tax=Viridothelium virens TaxID=1048519 RepID=A0A6A6GRX7_VIRVR|nr:DDE-domain-containing protein [Viridothelium virens]